MKVIKVQHSKGGKPYWFGVPENLAAGIRPGDAVWCDTQKGRCPARAVSAPVEEEAAHGDMERAGARFPLRNVVGVGKFVQIRKIKVPEVFQKSVPRDEKLASRFLEYFHTGGFDTAVSVNRDMTLTDGYSAYVVAKALRLRSLPVTLREDGKAPAEAADV